MVVHIQFCLTEIHRTIITFACHFKMKSCNQIEPVATHKIMAREKHTIGADVDTMFTCQKISEIQVHTIVG